jgi:hypothetical protein
MEKNAALLPWDHLEKFVHLLHCVINRWEILRLLFEPENLLSL